MLERFNKNRCIDGYIDIDLLQKNIIDIPIYGSERIRYGLKVMESYTYLNQTKMKKKKLEKY